MAERKFEIIGDTHVDCNKHCNIEGKSAGKAKHVMWCFNPKALNLQKNPYQKHDDIILYCNEPNAPKQDDGETERACSYLNRIWDNREIGPKI